MTEQQPLAVLIVEDDFEIREILTEVLEDRGYSVAGAAHGEEALDWLHQHQPPRLILLDLMMPVMDGRQFRAAQQADPRIADVPVIVLSADEADAGGASALGAVGHLQKPVRLATLLEIVDRYCA
jgi:CheY-like chemotaxis protein